MKNLRYTKVGDQIHIEDYPDAVALVEIDDPRVPLLQSLSLHRVDLTFADAALGYIREQATDDPLREILWYSAVARYFKCFQESKSRRKLEPAKVFSSEPTANETFQYFKALRNKHLLHDENAYSQCLIGAVINSPDAQRKIGDIVSIAVNAHTADQSHYESFFPLVHFTYQWVLAKTEELHVEIAQTLEAVPYEKLVSRRPLSFTMPPAGDISKRR
jgi:hypothetical protein